MTVSVSDSPPAKPPVQTVGQIANRQLLTCASDTRVSEAAGAMRQRRCSSIVVVRDERAVGIWTEHDALELDLSRAEVCDLEIAQVMSPDVLSIHEDVPVQEAGLRFRQCGVRHFLVVDHGERPVGMVTQTDVVLHHGVEHYLTFREVRAVMAGPPTALDPALSLADAATMMREAGSEVAVVAGGPGEEPGIITERDVIRALADRLVDQPIGKLAKRPLVAIGPHDSLIRARNLFIERGIRHLAVNDDRGHLVGLVSFATILNAMQHEYARQLNDALRERDEALLRSRKDLFLARKVIEAAQNGVMICSPQGVIEFVNPAFTTLTGYTSEEAVGQKPSLLRSGRHDRAFYDDMWATLLQNGQWQGEIWNRRKDGRIIAEWLSITTIRDESGVIAQYAAVFSDITERKQMEEKVKNLAYFDSLTGLPNRRLMHDRLALAIANAHRHQYQLGLMFLDLDLFKRINDTLGHAAGDAVLVETGRRLQAAVREGDTVARLGGDEFVLLLPEITDAADTAKLAERVICGVRKPVMFEGRKLLVTTSVGIAIYPDDATDAEELLKNADIAMYRAKDLGRNNYHLFSAAMNSRSHERLAMEDRLRRAMDNGELALAYQVKVDLATGRMCGAEALLRWHSPEMGLVPPSEFLPLAAKMGLMPALGEWVLATACAQNKAWRERGLPPVRMAVNLASAQFTDTRLATLIPSILAEAGLEPRWLELELEEAAVIEHPDEVRQVLEVAAGLGMRISIDDFGTRHSDLTSLRRLPVHALNIDRRFVAALNPLSQDAELVTAIIGLAHNLGMIAVAEGVETAAQADFLRRHHCDEIQGYLVARPLSAEDLVTLFDRDLLPVAGRGR
jgi:diguanylate cyclase (GGDEF)-like protein/PAS domain S-box-containing protein